MKQIVVKAIAMLALLASVKPTTDRPCPDCGCQFPTGTIGDYLRAYHDCKEGV